MLMSQVDHSRLFSLVSAALDKRATPVLDALDEMLAEATLVQPEEVPRDLVTMNSEVLVELPRGGSPRTVRLVYPAEKNGDDGLVSIFSPIGVALLGARVGSTIPLQMGAQDRALHVSALTYQPEANGDWDR